MAIYHLSVKTISRSAGRSATAAIAYRSGELIVDQRTGLAHDYTRRSGVEYKEIFLPENSPAWAADRSRLWNAAELAETRKNSTVAREFEVAIPADLNKAQRLQLVSEFARELVQRHGMAVDVAVHTPGKEGDERNHHAHILCSTRRLMPEGFTEKTRELDNQMSGEVIHWRQRWAEVSNQHLEKAGSQARIDHRSLEAQRAAAVERGDVEQAAKLDRVPTVHLGPNVVQMEQRGKRTERGDVGREIDRVNGQIIDFEKARKRIEAQKAEHGRDSQPRPIQSAGTGPSADRSDGELPAGQEDDGLAPLAERRPSALVVSPEKIKAEWQGEKARQFALVANRAHRIHDLAAGQLKRQEGRLMAHDKTRPQEPAGLFAGMKKTAHQQAIAVWRAVRTGLEKRWSQLQNRVHLVNDYMRKAPHEFYASAGEKLAERKAAQARPDLAATFKEVIEKEKAVVMATQRAKLAQRQRDKNTGLESGQTATRGVKAMSTEPKGHPLSSNPLDHAAAAKARDAKELQQLERDGRAVEAMGGEAAKTKQEENQTAGQTATGLNAKEAGESKEARARSILERYKERQAKERDDKGNDRGGRGGR